MKKILYTILCAICALCAVSCTATLEEPALSMEGNEGVLSLGIDFGTRAISTPQDTDAFVLRIYQYSDDKTSKNLVRKYTALADVPQYIWLLEGSYCVAVEVGDKSATASFDSKFFKGESDFTIVPKSISNVDVECEMQNVPVAVEFDSLVENHFTSGYYAYVCAAETFNQTAADAGSVPSLKYGESGKTGYFLMPEGCSTLCWHFVGTDDEANEVVFDGVVEDVKPKTLYTLKFTYSKDAGGSLVISATVDTAAEHRTDNIAFNPDPVVKGDGFNVADAYNYTSGNRKYIITALDNISLLTLTTADATLDLLNSSYDGIEVSVVSAKEYYVTLSEPFFNSLAGGVNELTLRIKDASGGIGVVTLTYGIQGVNAMTEQDYDLWHNTATMTATVFDTASTVQIAYRADGGEWKTLSTAGSGNIYTAAATDFAAGKTYDYVLLLGSTQTGKVLTLTTPAGAQIPNGGLEEWSLQDDKIWCPYSSVSSAFWGSGNNASAGLLGIDNNLTVASDDVRPGSTGTKSAYTHSLKASVMGIGKFAAGNLFVGEFVKVQGTNGIVDFGKPFTFNARPKALQFWMKNNCGTINEGSHATGTDLAKIFVCLCNREKPYTVNTGDSSTLFDPTTAEDIIACGLYESTESIGEWTKITINIDYKETTTIPNFLVLTYTCSGYGDYFTGSTNSWMYIDDIEFVY